MATSEAQHTPRYGSLHSGRPTGRVMKVHGLDCYVAEAPDGPPDGMVVIIPAATGWSLQNNRVMADCYAQRGGFHVLLPDFMNGTAVPEDVQTSFKAARRTMWWKNPLVKFGHLLYVLRYMLPFVYHCRPAVAGPRISGFLNALKHNEARGMPLGAAGIAWGGYFVIRACWEQGTDTTDATPLACGFVAHPSNTKFPDDVAKIERPLSWAAAETCRHMSPEQADMTEQILEAKTAKGRDGGIEHEFARYRGVSYGFAQSSDRKKFAEAEAGTIAEKQAVEWFVRCFAKNSV